MCGEKFGYTKNRGVYRGSPPRMRGKEVDALGFSCGHGITPAYAGKRLKSRETVMPSWDHPRVCGEKQVLAYFMQTLPGSPPRMRGKAEVALHADFPEWITPAYAGKSWFKLTRRRGHWGSPPRVRGKALVRPCWKLSTGITPACAGKSARRQAGPPGPAPPPQMRSGWSPPLCTGRQCRTRKSTHARRARIPAPAHTPAPQ